MMRDTQAFLSAILCLLLCGGFLWIRQDDAAFQSLVEAERSFARYSVAQGAREAFMKFFSDEGLVFRPNPVRYKEAMQKIPPPENPFATTLNWEPIIADVSADGALGYTTGPFLLTDNSPEKKPAKHGFYFTVWKKQSNGDWTVALDLGIQTEAPFTGDRTIRRAVFQKPPGLADLYKQSGVSSNSDSALAADEREYLSAVKSIGYFTALSQHLGEDPVFFRENMQPMIGRDAIEQELFSKQLLMTWKSEKAETARSADLGYTYGSYTQKERHTGAAVAEQGYYVRVWRRALDNKWRIVAEVTSPAKPNN